MHASRVVKITINDPDNAWKDLIRNMFAEYVFPVPSSLAKTTFRHPGANFILEIVPESPKILENVHIGVDPYQRPYLSILAVKAKAAQNIPRETVGMIQKWIGEASIVGNSWRVFIFQEDSSFFETNKQINRNELVAEQAQINNIVIIPCKKTKLADQSVDMVKNAVQHAVIESFGKFDQETRAKMKRKLGNVEALNYLKAWRGLLLQYYGYYEDALNSFLDSFRSSLPFVKDLSQFPLNPLNPAFINNYPFETNHDTVSVIYFALHGAMAVYFANNRFIEAVQLFYSFWGYVEELTRDKAHTVAVDDWALNCLKIFLSMQDVANNNSVNYRILERMFYLNLQKNTSEVPALRKRLLSVLPPKMKNTRMAVETRYARWAAEQKSDVPNINEKMITWKFGAKAALLNFDAAIESNNYREIERVGKMLLHDKSAVDDKQKIFNRILNVKQKLKLIKPFHISRFIKCAQFGSEVQQGTKMDITVKLVLPQWFQFDISRVELELENSDGNSQIEVNNCPESEISYLTTSFALVGDWKVTALRAVISNVTLEFPLKDKFLRFTIIPLQSPPIIATFPVLTCLRKSMFFSLKIDLSARLNKEINFDLFFRSDKVKIPNQSGKCQLSGRNGYFKIQDKRILFSFEQDVSEDDAISIAGLEIEASIEYILMESLDETELVIAAEFDGTKFEIERPATFYFPIDLNIRTRTDDFVHVRLQNTSEIDLMIESAEIMPTTWEKIALSAGSDTYLLATRTPGTDSILNIIVSEPLGSKIANSWDLGKEKIGLPMIDAKIADERLMEGEPSSLTIELPECDFCINECKSIALACPKKKHFEGGTLEIDFIPLKHGYLRMPTITIDDEEFILNPQFLNVKKSNVPSYIPFVYN